MSFFRWSKGTKETRKEMLRSTYPCSLACLQVAVELSFPFLFVPLVGGCRFRVKGVEE